MTKARHCCLLIAVFCYLLAGFAVGEGSKAPAVKMQAAVDYPAAGVSFAAPQDYESQGVAEAFDVARFACKEAAGDAPAGAGSVGQKRSSAIILSAYPVTEKATSAKFADEMITRIKHDLAISNLTVTNSTTMSVAGADAVAKLLNYTYRGTKTTAAKVFFIREEQVADRGGPAKAPTSAPSAGISAKNLAGAPAKVRVCYVLTLEAAGGRQADLPALLTEVVKSIKLIPFERPVEMGVKEFEGTLRDAKLGFAIKVPRMWYGDLTLSGAEMAQTDYIMGGAPMPMVRVLTSEAETPANSEDSGKPVMMAKDACKKVADRFKKSVADAGAEFALVSQGEAKMAGVDGWEIALKVTPKSLRPTQDEAVVVVQRFIYAGGGADGAPKNYSVRLQMQATDVKLAQDLLGKITATFEVIKPAPTSGPTTTSAPASLPSSAPADRGDALQ